MERDACEERLGCLRSKLDMPGNNLKRREKVVIEIVEEGG
jgi:hypothetical protein